MLTNKLKNFKIVLGYKSIIALAFFAAGVGTTLVFASIPDASGQISACYRNTLLQKTFRVIDSEAGQTCSGNETLLSWNQMGSSGVEPIAPGSQLGAAPIIYRNLSNADLTGVNFAGSNITGTNFTNANLTNVNFYTTTGGYINLTGANVNNANFEQVSFYLSKLAAIDLGNRTVSGAITSSNLSGANFNNTTFAGASLDDSNLANANLTNAIFQNGINGQTPSLARANFAGANITGVTWGSSTICPDETISGDHANTCVGHL